ncbi:neutral alpha-glucosidase C [Spea bombifrons]|uniref:neutral alpha-glucosidase C n=1 Tax=Spea bombifrons TaxID=233779 RepID=UPI0023493DFD|nr:neutral alpha-glucosidase C [Spea bombifrons]
MSSPESAPLPRQASTPDDLLGGILVEDKSKFKSCNEIGFYRRQQCLPPGQSLYHARLDTLMVEDSGATFQILHQETKVPLQVELNALKGGIFRLKINEVSPLRPRYEVPDVLVGEPATERLVVSKRESGIVVLEYPHGVYKLHIIAQPFSISITHKNKPLISVNSQGLLYFEHLLSPPKESVGNDSQDSAQVKRRRYVYTFYVIGHFIMFHTNHGRYNPSPAVAQSCYMKYSVLGFRNVPAFQNESGLWKERFANFVDIKANGPTSVGLDFSLHGFEYLYGIPEHADTHRLQDTGESEAYRLYNLDVFGYRVADKMGIYGSVPLLLAHKPSHTCGVFWLNSSETLVEIHSKAALQASAHTQKQRAIPQLNVRWMSESGIVDAFLMMGPTPQDVFKQYAQLTGTQSLPPRFSLGYHQCRWNYEDEADVEAVDSGFDEHNIPYDVIWLDIEHTDGKRYFTWDPERFHSPERMQEKLREKRRKLVVISDPHVKVDPNYTLYTEAKDKGFFVKTREGQDFVGNCWPGSSSYLDFTNPAARDWYSSQFALNVYKGSTDILFVWNDMNEPSVFEESEVTMPKSALHHQGWEHRDVHNLYGFYQQMSTSEGLTQRSGGQERPFVLTRSFFAGSQRYGAVWTGDNKAEWEYLKISIPMLLTLNVTGISFCGADVGGFFGDPEPELLVRWYQAGAFQPFFRGHSIRDSHRREPWLFGESTTCLIRKAIEERYILLPYWYLLFYRAHVNAEPVMRPLWAEFPKHPETFDVENQYMLGSALLIVPIMDSGTSSLDVLFPGSGERWYNFRNFECIRGPHKQKVGVTLEEIPVYQRGGSIIPMHCTVGKSTGWMEGSPYKLHIALDSKGSAAGELFIDDGHSFKYLHEHMFSHRRFTFQKNILSCRSADKKGQFPAESILEKVLILGFKRRPSKISVHSEGGDGRKVIFTYNHKLCLLTLESLSLDVSADWTIHITSFS